MRHLMPIQIMIFIVFITLSSKNPRVKPNSYSSKTLLECLVSRVCKVNQAAMKTNAIEVVDGN
jgi:hypothetical protein